MNEFHQANRARWNLASKGWAAMHDRRGTWRHAHESPKETFTDLELELLDDVAGKEVCVLGSGDNLAVFALAGLGASVTSVDISEKQLRVAKRRAGELHLEVNFIEADVTDLNPIPDESFDVVYTGGHVAVWVSDIRRYYGEAIRLLRPGGLLLINEYHPFRRVWQEVEDRLEVGFSYFSTGPHRHDASEDLFDPEPGEITQYEFHWTVSQILNAVIEQGVTLTLFEEYGEEVEGWEVPPLAGLPNWLLVAGRKN